MDSQAGWPGPGRPRSSSSDRSGPAGHHDGLGSGMPGGARARASSVSRRRGATGCSSRLLGSAFIDLAWLGLIGLPLWGALDRLPDLRRSGIPLGVAYRRAIARRNRCTRRQRRQPTFPGRNTDELKLHGYHSGACCRASRPSPAFRAGHGGSETRVPRRGDRPSVAFPAKSRKEMQWFIEAAEPFKGMDINVVSETITTHEYESKVLAKAFSEITGINVTHDLIGEGDVIEKLQTQMQSGENIYDAYVNDSDLIGTHWRYQQVAQPHRLDGRRRRGRHQPDPRRRRFHRHVSSPPARTASSTSSRPAVRQPLLVPLRLVHRSRDQGRLQGDSTATSSACRSTGRPMRTSPSSSPSKYEIDGQQGLRPHGLRQEGPVPRLALHRCLAVHGRRRRQGHPERPAGRRMGHPRGRELAARRAPASPAAAPPTARPPSMP